MNTIAARSAEHSLREQGSEKQGGFQRTCQRQFLACLLVFGLTTTGAVKAAEKTPAKKFQYRSKTIVIPGAHSEEPVLPTVSTSKGLAYVENAALAWAESKKCVSCHTTGSYMLARPELSKYVGRPSDELRQFFIKRLEHQHDMPDDKLHAGLTPTRMSYLAGGLVEWDRHLNEGISDETKKALKLMFRAQAKTGEWGNTECWPPFESSDYHATTVAVMAAAGVPEWINAEENAGYREQFELAKNYLTTSTPPHDYARLLLLWTATRVPDLIDSERKTEIIDMMWKHQLADGGWSIRTFAKPEEWGNGNRADKLHEEDAGESSKSDGHQTGLAVIVLRDAGVPASDPRIQKAVDWLKTNQRESGRWWTRSLNNDNWHFITYSGTCYSLLALAKCDALPQIQKTE